VAPNEKGPRKSKRTRISDPYIPYGLFQTKGETCAKFGSDRFRNVDLYKLHTYIQTNKHASLYIRYTLFIYIYIYTLFIYMYTLFIYIFYMLQYNLRNNIATKRHIVFEQVTQWSP